MDTLTMILVAVISVLVTASTITIILLYRQKISWLDAATRYYNEAETMKENYEKQIADEKAACIRDLREIRKNFEEETRKIREGYKNECENYSLMNEKELLVNVMLALDGYNSRFERLETVFGQDRVAIMIQQMVDATENQVNQLSETITNHMEELKINEKLDSVKSSTINQVTQLSSSIINYMKELKINENLDAVKAATIKQVEEVKTSIIEHTKGLNISEELCSIKKRLNDNRATIDNVVGSIEGIAGKIKDIQSDVSLIRSSVTDEYKHDSLASNISSIKNDVDEIKSDVDDVKTDVSLIRSSVTDKYEYDSLARTIDSIRDDVEEIKGDVSSAKSAAEDAKSAAEDVMNEIQSRSY